MSAVRWYLRRWARMLGWQGLLGAGLAAAAVMLYLSGIEPARSRIGQLQQEALSVRDFARKDGVAVSGDEGWLQQFYGLLPAKASAPDWLRIVFSAASSYSIDLAHGDYKMNVNRNGRLLSYEIGLPVRGTYVQIRQFIADVLDRVPAIALDEFTVKREAIGDPRIDASIRFTLFLNGGP